MQDFTRYSYTIRESNLLPVLKDAASHGYQPIVIINGEFYAVQLDTIPAPSADSDEIF